MARFTGYMVSCVAFLQGRACRSRPPDGSLAALLMLQKYTTTRTSLQDYVRFQATQFFLQ